MSEQKWIIVDKAVPKDGNRESYRYRGRRWANTIKQAVPFTSWEDAVKNLGHVIKSGVAYRPVLCRVRPSLRRRLDVVTRERDLALTALAVLEREVDALTATLTDVAAALTTQEHESVFEAACRTVRERDRLRLTRTNRS